MARPTHPVQCPPPGCEGRAMPLDLSDVFALERPRHSTLNYNTAHRTKAAASYGMLSRSPAEGRRSIKPPAPFLRAFGSIPTEHFQYAAGKDPTTAPQHIEPVQGPWLWNTPQPLARVRGRALRRVDLVQRRLPLIRGSGRATDRKPADSQLRFLSTIRRMASELLQPSRSVPS